MRTDKIVVRSKRTAAPAGARAYAALGDLQRALFQIPDVKHGLRSALNVLAREFGFVRVSLALPGVAVIETAWLAPDRSRESSQPIRCEAAVSGGPGEPAGLLSVEFCPASAAERTSSESLCRLVAEMIEQSLRLRRLSGTDHPELLGDNANLRLELGQRYDFARLVGDSHQMRQVYEQVAQVASANTTVLIVGESGTGKELVASAVQKNSTRAAGPFVKVNCAALPEGLVEAELFGFERGAFTGAQELRRGRFEQAQGGTLFLDEVSELSLPTQAKLLRVLQEREFERVGGQQIMQADVRLIVATSRDLERETSAGRFRTDLFYRLNVFTIPIPPLRERREDIPALALHFLNQYAAEKGKDVRQFSGPAMKLLLSYDWPGNVRELENVVERATVLADRQSVQHYHLPPSLQTLPTTKPAAGLSLFETVEAFEQELICDALRVTRGNRTQAAKSLRVSERVLTYKVKKYEIDPTAYRG